MAWIRGRRRDPKGTPFEGLTLTICVILSRAVSRPLAGKMWVRLRVDALSMPRGYRSPRPECSEIDFCPENTDQTGAERSLGR